MKKILIPIVILLLALLAACGGEAPVDTSAVATQASEVVDEAVDTVTEAEETAVEEEPVASATGCYWQDSSSNEWVPVSEIGLENTTFEQCYALDSCFGGLGESDGGCYKWADSSDGDPYAWDSADADANLPTERWAGTVLGGGTTTISINGVETQSDASGNFELAVPTAADSRYVINADQDGALPISLIHIGSAVEDLVLEFQPAETFAVDPAQPITVEDSRGTQIEIEANQLVDANGNPATEELTLETYTYDLTEEPMVGDMSALNTDGELVAMESAGAFSAEFTDGAGGEYNLAEGAVAEISIPAEVEPRPDEVLTVWSYDPETGLWIEEGPATLVDGRYVAEVSHFSTWNFDWEMRSPACVKLEVSADLLAETSPMQVKAVLQTNPVSVRTLQVADAVNVLTNLPTNTDVQFFMPADAATPFRTVNTGAAWGSTGTPAFPYDVCNGVAEIVPAPPAPTTGTLQGQVSNAVDSSALANAQVCIQATSQCVTTDANGNYEITDVPAGEQMLTVTAEGYITANDETFTMTAGESFTRNVALPQELVEGELLIKLSWGAEPSDLDSHLWLPNGTEIYHGNTNAPNAKLDRDEQSGNGTETITISQLEAGTYTYAVYNYSGTPSMTVSEAVVRVFRGDQEINIFTLPTTGDGRWWTVFTIDGATGTITPVNSFSDSEPQP